MALMRKSVGMEARPTSGREVRRIALVRVTGKLLRVFAAEQSLSAGDRIRIRIDGACECVRRIEAVGCSNQCQSTGPKVILAEIE